MLRKVLIFLGCVFCLCSCSDRGKVIPPETLSQIYARMYVVDQWVQKNPSARRQIDTTLVYDQVFGQFGYTYEDYDRTVRRYIERPDRFEKVFKRTKAILDKRRAELEAMKEIEARNAAFDRKVKGSYDSLFFWPVHVDTVDFEIYAERRDSVRTDQEPTLRQLPGDKLVAKERKML